MKAGFFDYLTGGTGAGRIRTKENFKVVKPIDFTHVQMLIDGLKRGEGYIADFEEADGITAQRMLDLLSGACYALDARVEPVKSKMYLLLPAIISVKTRKQKE